MKNLVAILSALLILTSCAKQVALGPVYLYPKVEPIEIELMSFSFYPNHIAILKNQSPFAFHLKNTSKIKHNFTLMDSHKNILVSIDVMQNKSTTVTIESLTIVIILSTATGSFTVFWEWKECLWWISNGKQTSCFQIF